MLEALSSDLKLTITLLEIIKPIVSYVFRVKIGCDLVKPRNSLKKGGNIRIELGKLSDSTLAYMTICGRAATLSRQCS